MEMGKEKLKFLIVIVASDSIIYNKMKKLYINFIKSANPINIKFIFICNGGKKIKIADSYICGAPIQEILLDIPETVDNMIYKTLYLINKYKELEYFDYFIRTNLSTVFDFNKLIKFITLINNIYKNVNEYIIMGTITNLNNNYKNTMLSGTNLIMSRKIIEKLNKHIDYNENFSSKYEDQMLSKIIFEICHNIVLIGIPRIDFLIKEEKETMLFVNSKNINIENENIFCYRFKTDNRENDIFRMSLYMESLIKNIPLILNTSLEFHENNHLTIRTPRVFIYGNKGYIGSNLINYLRKDFDIYVLNNNYIKDLKESDYIIFAVYDWKNQDNNLDLIKQLVLELKNANVNPNIIYTSSGVVNCEENKETEYYKIKVASEKLFKELYPKTVLLRVGSIWGGKTTNNLRLINKMIDDIIKKGYIDVANRGSTRYILHIYDLSEVIKVLINNKVENGIYEYYTEKLKMFEIVSILVDKFKAVKIYNLKNQFNFKIELNKNIEIKDCVNLKNYFKNLQ